MAESGQSSQKTVACQNLDLGAIYRNSKILITMPNRDLRLSDTCLLGSWSQPPYKSQICDDVQTDRTILANSCFETISGMWLPSIPSHDTAVILDSKDWHFCPPWGLDCQHNATCSNEYQTVLMSPLSHLGAFYGETFNSSFWAS